MWAVCQKLYCKSIWTKSQQYIAVLIQNVMYMFSWQINGWILKDALVKVKKEVQKMATVAEKVYMDLVARGKDIETAKRWRHLTMKFEVYCGTKSEYARDDVIRYLCCLREQGYRQSSIDVMVRPLKLLAQIQAWTFPRLAMPKVRDGDVRRPMFSHDEVCQMIRRGKEVLSAREVAYLALSTTYGLRREELSGLGRIDGKVTVDTVKGGPVTTHVVPVK